MGILKLPQLLLIAGNGRDSGKTTLACFIIQKFSHGHQVMAIKISPHQQKIATGGNVICDTENLYIAEETDAGTRKDSSRMLKAGASRSFFIWSDAEHLPAALRQIMQLADDHTLFVCESGGLRQFAEPGIFLIVGREESDFIKPATRNLLEFDHEWVTFNGHHFNLNLNEIVIHQNSWEKITDYDII